MYALLLFLGAAITIAGVVLLGAGVPVGGRLYDPTVVTPGAVAVIGGLLLLGLGFTVHVLGRIERALAARPLANPAPADGTAAAAVAAEPPSVTPTVMPPPLPEVPPAIELELNLEPEPAAAAPVVRAEDADEQQLNVQDKFPALVRLDNAVALEEADVALAKSQTRLEALGGFNTALAPRGPVPPPRAVPRRDPPIRTAARPERRSLDSVWPKRGTPIRSSPAAQSAEQLVVAEPVPSPEPVELAAPAEVAPSPPAQLREPATKPPTNGAGAEAAVPVSILKSGIVDGMAYTLYSDGSIEAQLRDGTLRFNSITELRNHVEQNS